MLITLEILGQSDGLYYDFNESQDWIYLLTEIMVEEDTLMKMYNELSRLDFIDAELWRNKVLWVTNYVGRHPDAFRRAKEGAPQKPSVNNKKPKKVKATPAPTISSSPDDLKVSLMQSLWEEKIGKQLTPKIADTLVEISTTYPDDWYEKAIDEVLKMRETDYVQDPLNFITACLENWQFNGRPSTGGKGNGKTKDNKLPARGSYTPSENDEV